MTILTFVLRPPIFKVPAIVIVISMQLSATAFSNLAPMLEELGLLTTSLGQLSLPVSMTHESMIWVFWVLLILAKSLKTGFLTSVFPLSIIIAFTTCFLGPAMHWVTRKMPDGQQAGEIYFVSVLLGAAIMAGVFDVVAGAPALGAAFFGLVVPNGPPLGSAIAEKGEMFINHCFLPFFYIAIGDMTNIYAMKDNWKAHLTYQIIIVIGHLTKTLATAFSAMAYYMSPRQGLALGVVLNTSGVVHGMYFWTLWLRQRMENDLSSQLVLSSLVVTTSVNPLVLHLHKKRRMRQDDHSTQGFELSIQAASPSPRFQIIACVDDKDMVPGIITLLETCNNQRQSSSILVYVVHLNELVGQATPILMPHKKHNRICQHNGCHHITSALRSYSDDCQGSVVVQLLTMIAPFKNMHEGICRLSQDKMIPLIIVPFVYKSAGEYRKHALSSDLNRKIQKQTPCMVGIFVDRGIGVNQQTQDGFSCRVVEIFFGGEDDREALAYAAQMCEHQGVSITVLRVLVQDFGHLSAEDKDLDEDLFDFVRSRISHNANGFFKEIGVKGWLQAIQVVRSLDNNYDLVMVGCRHGETTLQESEMAILSENPELGHVVEMHASTEFHQGTVSVLVMQHYVEFDRDALESVMLLEED